MGERPPTRAGGRRPLYVYSGGFLTEGRVRRILELSGWDIRLGAPGADGTVGVWGQRRVAARGQAVADLTGASVLTVEDAFLRSLFPGRVGEPTLGLLLDDRGVHYDARTPSALEHMLATAPLDDTAMLDRARDAIDRIRAAHLTKFAAVDPKLDLPPAGYVLVIDQARDDASVLASGGTDALFQEMLVFAQEEHPGCPVVIKTHPETEQGQRGGYFSARHASDRVQLIHGPISPWRLFEGAVGVYTVSSGLGFEAIFADHKPRVFGQPFYAGWGLTADETPVARRQRRLTKAQLFAAAMIMYPVWYDPYRNRLCELEDVIAGLEAQAHAWRDDRHGYVASGMRLWKRGHLQRVFGRHQPVRFRDPPARARAEADRLGCPLIVWAGKETPEHQGDQLIRLEDGVLRSRGLGSKLTPPLSLARDDLGIYYDPSCESRLDRLLSDSANLTEPQRVRATALISTLTGAGLSKYNTGKAALPDLPEGRRVLVPGQVEDDASILKGCPDIATNAGLLQRTRQENPDAVILYKPHPDVAAGLRAGEIDANTSGVADVVLGDVDAATVLSAVDEVWTLTSTMGFEALIRDRPVTCLGMPFYAGWGLTRDLVAAPVWRTARPDITALAHAVLIGYPRYHDPISGLPCPVEVAVARLISGEVPPPGSRLRIATKLQGLLATWGLWRR